MSKVLIKQLPKNLNKIEEGFYNLTDKEYFSEELSKVAHSQSYIKKIKRQSFLRIDTDRKKKKDSKALRIGRGGHDITLLGREVFTKNFIVKKKVEDVISKNDYLERAYQDDPKISIPDLAKKKEFVSEVMEGIVEPEKFPTQKDYVANGGLKENWKADKEKRAKELEAYKKKKKAVEARYQELADFQAQKKEEAAKQKAKYEAEWSVIKEDYDSRKNKIKEDLEYAKANDITILSEEELETVELIRRTCEKSHRFQDYKKNSHAELAAIVRDDRTGLWVKSKGDLIDFNSLTYIDLKTADDIDEDSFYYDFWKREYDIQLGSYYWGWKKLGYEFETFVMAVVSKQAEEIAFYNISMEIVKAGMRKFLNRAFKYASEMNDYAVGISRYDEIIEFKSPSEREIDDVFNDEQQFLERV